MTVEVFSGAPLYVIAGTGPYEIPHPYAAGAIRASVVTDREVIALDEGVYTITPTAGEIRGDLHLVAAVAALHGGQRLMIERRTIDEQGWEGRVAERERGLERQLDVHTMAIQELRRDAEMTVRSLTPISPIVPQDGRSLVFDDGRIVPGPSVGEIEGAAGHAASSSLDAASARQSATSIAIAVGNADFAHGYTGWSTNAGGTTALAAAQGPIGPAGGFIRAYTRADASISLFNAKRIALVAGRSYRVRSRVLVTGGTSRIYIGVSTVDAAGAIVGPNSGRQYLAANAVDQAAGQGIVEYVSLPFSLASLRAATPSTAGVVGIAVLNQLSAPGVSTSIEGIWIEDVSELVEMGALAAGMQGVVADSADLAHVLSDTRLHAPGTVIRSRAEGYAYVVVTSDPDLTTAGGVMLRVLHDGTADPRAFGAQAGADATAALQRAVASGAGIVDGGGLTYRLNATLRPRAGQTLKNMALDCSAFPGSPSRTFISVAGAGIVDTVNVVGNIVPGDYTLTVAAGGGAGFAAGDYVLISSEQTYAYTGATVKRGEIKRIRSVAGNVVRFREGAYESYNQANGAIRLHRLDLLPDVTIDNVRLVGTNGATDQNRGVDARWTVGLRVVNCTFRAIDTYCCALFNCIEPNITNNRFEGVYYEGAGSAFYAIALFNCCNWAVIHGNIGEEVRHLVTVSSSASYYGQPFFYVVSSNVMHNAMAGGATDSWAFENHGFGRWGVWVGNTADGCRVGFNMERGDQLVANNIVRNYSLHGFYCDNSGLDLVGLSVVGNQFDGPSVGAAAARNGIRIEVEAASIRTNIRIADNIVNCRSEAGAIDGGIYVGAGSGTAVNCVIESNTVTNAAPGYEAGDYGIQVQQAGWDVVGNSLSGFGRGIRAAAPEMCIANNRVRLAAQGSAGAAIEVTGSGCTVVGNEFRNAYRAVAINAGSVGTRVAGNTEINSANSGVLDNGTGTQLGFGSGGF